MNTVNDQSHGHSRTNSNHLATKMVAALFVLWLTLTQGVLAQSTNGFAKAGALTTTTNGIIQLQPLTISLPDHTLTGSATITVNTPYRMPAVDNAVTGTGSADVTVADSPKISAGWAQRAAARMGAADADDREALLKRLASH